MTLRAGERSGWTATAPEVTLWVVLDLHAHTLASDGALSPAALVARAAALGVRTLAITDHDTLEGYLEAPTDSAVEVLAGIELSTRGPRGRSLHILGYLFDPHDPGLKNTIARVVHARESRNRQMLDRLEALGMPLDPEALRRLAGNVVGRPHFAAAMVARGYVADRGEAFEKWLGDGRPAYVAATEALSPEEAIVCLHAAGGVAVLAHPLQYAADPHSLNKLLHSLHGAGLDGVEIYYPGYSPAQRAMIQCFAERYGLVPTGGSDFHRDPTLPLPEVPPECLERLRDKSQERRRNA